VGEEVISQVRTVPVGLWRALLVRDGGCTWPGCDAPAAWCDVAHGQTPFAENGRLMPANAALLCRSHHRRFDLGPWTIHVRGDQVTYLRPTAQPRAGPGPIPANPTLPGVGPPEHDAPTAGRAPPLQRTSTPAQQPPPLPSLDSAAEDAGGGWATPDGRFVSDLDELR